MKLMSADYSNALCKIITQTQNQDELRFWSKLAIFVQPI